jgi:glycine/D-amino acid oxidase-like deaminating enzyme
VTNVRVIDFDLEGALSSSELNAGGVRATFHQPINVEFSRETMNWLDGCAEEVGYRPCGYLWLRAPEHLPAALEERELHQRLGWEVQVWDVPKLKAQVPFLDKTDGIAAAFFAPRDGLINPNLLKSHYRSLARAAGARFDDRTLVRAFTWEATGCRVETERFEQVLAHESKLEVLTHPEQDQKRLRVIYRAKRVVNCAGPWAAHVAKLAGYGSPSFAQRRQMSVFDCRDVDLRPYGMMIDTSGVYFHPESSNGLAGFATPDEPRGYNYQYDGARFFEEVLWPALYERSSQFERLKHLTGWAGLYEVSPDETAILGAVEAAPAAAKGRLFEAHSFSGHGVMHSWAAGRALAELMTTGRFETLDGAPLSGSRFETGELLHEKAVI